MPTQLPRGVSLSLEMLRSCGAVGTEGGWQLDMMISKVFSNLNG